MPMSCRFGDIHAVATNVVGKIDLQSTPCVVRMTFARAALPAYNKN